MSEDLLLQINNKLNHKRIEIYEIIDTTNDNGEILLKFSEQQKYDENFDYTVSLLSAECSSMFPNIIKDKNNLLHVSVQDQLDTLRFETGAYEIEDINRQIQDFLPNELVIIELDKATGKSKIKLKPTVKIHFDQEKSIREILGYNESIILDKSINNSPNICNVMETQKIFIYLDIIKGSWFNGKPSSILYSFSNDIGFGMPISIKPKHKQESLLFKHTFNEIKFNFKNEKGDPINFMNTPVILTLEIRQV